MSPAKPRRLPGASPIAAVALIAAGIAACGGGTGNGAGDLLPTASTESISAVLAPCDAAGESDLDPVLRMASTAGWIKVEEVLTEEWSDGDPDTLVASIRVDEWDGTGGDLLDHPALEGNVQVFDSYGPGVDWGLEVGADVWLGLADYADLGRPDFVDYVVLILPDGRAVFPGECEYHYTQQPLESFFAEGFDAEIGSLVGSIPVAIGYGDEISHDVDILNPEETDAEELERLQFAVVHISVTEALGDDYTICTKVDSGWNDCVVPNTVAESGGHVVDAYLDGSLLEVWLLDSHANLVDPIARLGTVSLGNAPTGSLAIRLEVDTAGLANAPPPSTEEGARVRTVEVIALEDLDHDDPDWPGLRPTTFVSETGEGNY